MMKAPNLPEIWRDLVAYRRVYFLTAVVAFGGMLFGWDTGLIGGVLTMTSFRDSFDIHPEQDAAGYANLSGNIVSVLQAGCFFGAAASFYLSDKLGRKTGLIVADIIFLIGSIIQTTCAIGTTELGQLYAGRVIGGFGVGLISAIVPTYIGEAANKEIRGRCIGTMQLFNVSGIALAFFVNYGTSKHIPSTESAQWRIPFALQMLPGILLLIGLLFQPESPRWYVEKNKFNDARRALAIVRAKPLDHPSVTEELEEIMADSARHEGMTLAKQMKFVFSDSKITYVFYMAITLMLFQQWTGTNSINYFAPQIFQAIGLASDNSTLFATGIYGVVKMVFTALALMFAVEQLGRKWCLIIGGLGQAFAMFYIGVNQAVHPVHKGDPLTGNNIFAIVCVYLFVVFYSFGWGAVPFVLSSETSPNHVRSFIMASALMMQWLMNFVIAKLTPIMLNSITFGTFLLFGACCLAMVVWTIVFVPETANVPLESMYLLFEKNIIRGAIKDTIPKYRRSNTLKFVRNVEVDLVGGEKAGDESVFVERASSVEMPKTDRA